MQLTDPKGRLHTVVLQPGKAFHTHRGALAHDDLIGAPEGTVVKAQPSGTQYLALRPLLPTSCCRCRAAPRWSTRRTRPRSWPWPTSSRAPG